MRVSLGVSLGEAPGGPCLILRCLGVSGGYPGGYPGGLVRCIQGGTRGYPGIPPGGGGVPQVFRIFSDFDFLFVFFRVLLFWAGGMFLMRVSDG